MKFKNGMNNKRKKRRKTHRQVFKLKGPKLALQFFHERNCPPDAKREYAVRLFHKFIQQKKLVPSEVTPAHIQELLSRLSKTELARTTRQGYRYYLYTYLDWLFANGKIGFDPQSVRQHKEYVTPLPHDAQRFVRSLTTLKPGSLNRYCIILRSFYRWFNEQNGQLSKLTHLQMTDWFNWLKQRGLQASTRMHYMVFLRVYFRWCYEQSILNTDPDDLIRSTDLPPVPSYLPRPLHPDLDLQLRFRLRQSSNVYCQGLLLMRNTGLRIGELISLEFDCIRTDFQGRHFLKVPLGKLNSERLVPLDEETYQLILRLQTNAPHNRSWLLLRPSGKQTCHYHFQNALDHVCKGLKIPDRMTTHRLRHTYATTLLNAGMTLVGVMKLLGHRNIRTTLRYAAITHDTMVNDFFKAMAEIENQYPTLSNHSALSTDEPNPVKMLEDVLRWLQKTFAESPSKKPFISALTKRIKYLQTQIQELALSVKDQ
ncbi:MAG: tyrosine-type recombinase/integrase [Pseudomonadota bacterium]